MAAIREDFPEMYSALIGERDSFMAESIENADSNTMVGVVGIAHMDGIEKALIKDGYTVLQQNNCSESER